MQAITTKYLGPTNHRGGRVKAYAQAGTVTIPWDHAADVAENHWAAADALRCRLGWDREHIYGRMVMGGLPDTNNHAYCFVFTGRNGGQP